MTGEAQLGGTHLYFKGEKEEKGKALAYNQLPMSSSKEVYNFFNLDQKGRGDLLLKLRSEKGEWIDISLIEDLTPIYHDPSAGEPLGEQANQYALVAVQFGRQDKEPEQADAFPRPGSEGNGAQSEGGLPAPDEPGDAGDDEALPRLRPGGRLYLFRPDENTSSGVAFWREIAINQDGFYKEVDVHGNENGQDERAATGPPHSHVILPKRWVGGDGASQNSLELYIAYSDITWTWGRIEQLESNRAELEKRTTRVTMGSSRIKQDETTGDNVVLIEDPLERARELASYCHDLLEYYELVEQRKPETEFGEAVLIDEIIKANKADSEGPYLGGHVNEVEIDAVIDRWHPSSTALRLSS